MYAFDVYIHSHVCNDYTAIHHTYAHKHVLTNGRTQATLAIRPTRMYIQHIRTYVHKHFYRRTRKTSACQQILAFEWCLTSHGLWKRRVRMPRTRAYQVCVFVTCVCFCAYVCVYVCVCVAFLDLTTVEAVSP